MFTIGNIITLAISVAMVLVFRQIDKDNRSIDKVKKFTDKIKNDLDVYFDGRSQTLKNAAVDLDVKQTQAIASVKRLEKLREEFSVHSETIETRTASLVNIENRMAGYDSALTNLTDMTARAEENLQRLAKESTHLDRYSKRLTETQEKISQLEALIPKINEEFDRRNSEKLQNLGANLLSEFSDSAAKIQESVNYGLKQADDLFDMLNTKIQATYADAARKANTLEETAFTQLETKGRERLDSYTGLLVEKDKQIQRTIEEKNISLRKNIEEQISSLHADLDKQIKAVQEDVLQDNTEFQAGLQQQHMEFKNQIEQQIQDSKNLAIERIQVLQQNIEEQNSGLQQNYGSQVQEIKETLERDLETMKNATATLKEKWKAELENYIEIVRSEIQTISVKYGDVLQNLDIRFVNFEKQTLSKLEDFDGRLDENDNRLQQGFKLASDQIAAFKADIARSIQDTSVRLAAFDTEFTAQTTALQANLEAKEQHINLVSEKRISQIESALDTKIFALDVKVDNSCKDLNKICEDKYSSLFTDISSRFDTYKAEVWHRFEMFDKTANDIELIEKNLQQAMKEAQKQVVASFTDFSNSQTEKHSAFESALLEKNKGMSSAIKNLEAELNNLKSQSYNNVSEKLKVFEDEFFADLNSRGESLNTAMKQWESNLDNRMIVLSSEFEDSRRKIEMKYGEDLKERLNVVNEKYREQTARLEEQLKTTEQSFLERLSQGDESVRQYVEQVRKDFDIAKSSADEYLKKEFEAHSSATGEQLKKQDRELAAQIKRLLESVDEARNASISSLDAVRDDFNLWKERLIQQFAESKEGFEDKLLALDTKSDEMVQQIANTYKLDVQSFHDKARDEKQRVLEELDNLKGQINQSIVSYETRSGEMVEEFRKSYEGMLDDTQKRIREQNAEAEQKLRALKNLVQEIRDKTEASQEKMVLKIQTDANALNMTMDDIDKRLKNFIAQTQLFDKAEDLKNHLDSEISGLKTDISKMESFRQIATDLEQQFIKIRRMEEDVTQKISKFTTERKRIEIMESDFNHLITMSATMDQKITELRTTNDDLQVLQLEVRRFQESLADISARYDRLEKKNEVLEQTIIGVDKSFENLKQIEKRLATCNQEADQFPYQIRDIKQNIEKLLDNNSRVNDVVEKLSSLDSVLADTENRITEMQKAREWLARTETRLTEISKQAQDQVKLMGDLFKSDSVARKKEAGAPPIGIRENVTKLAHQGWTVDEIARAVQLSKGEVELILELGVDGK